MKNPKPIIGITGGIGAGKSTVASVLQSLGSLVIDSDRLAHEELDAPEVIAALKASHGGGIIGPTGRIDRKALGSAVFDNAAALEELENLLYPRLKRRRATIIAKANDDPAVKAIVLDAPKLYEAGVDRECDAVIFVDADESKRCGRVASGRGWGPEELARRENRQIPLDVKRTRADYIVANHSTIDELRPELERILFSVLAKSTGRSDHSKEELPESDQQRVE